MGVHSWFHLFRQKSRVDLGHTVHLDSDDWKLCRRTVRGDQDRWKLRVRYYPSHPDYPVFCEVKHQLKWGAHAPSRAGFRALAEHIGTLASPTVWCFIGRSDPTGEGAGRHTRGRVCSPKRTASFQLIRCLWFSEREPPHVGCHLLDEEILRMSVTFRRIS